MSRWSGDGGECLVAGHGVIVQPCTGQGAEDGRSGRGNDTVPERVVDERCTSG